MRIAAITMQKNEDHCLEPWIRHHGYLFGFDNIIVIDHASDSPHCRGVLEKYGRAGVQVVRLSGNMKFDDKGEFVFREFSRLRQRGHYDFFFPIDCDELLFLKEDDSSVTASRQKIEEYLDAFSGYDGRLYIRENYLRILGHPEYYWIQPYQKVFFFAPACLGLDHGFHIGRAKDDQSTEDTRLVYAHFHFKPYEVNKRLSIGKLRDYVDVNDLDALRSYEGPGVHLKGHLLATKEEYESGFVVDGGAVHVRQIDNHLTLIGIDPAFCDADIWTKARDDCNTIFADTSREVVLHFHKEGADLEKIGCRLDVGKFSKKNFDDGTDLDEWSQVYEIEADLRDVVGISEIRLVPAALSAASDRRLPDLVIEAGFVSGSFFEIFRVAPGRPAGVSDGDPLTFRPGIPIPARFVRLQISVPDADYLDRIEVYGGALPEMLSAALAGRVVV